MSERQDLYMSVVARKDKMSREKLLMSVTMFFLFFFPIWLTMR
jgi:hypothetical protein